MEELQRQESDKELYWLKIFANSIFGRFAEMNPETLPTRKSARVRVYSGEDSYIPKKRYRVLERQGKWYAPYLASLITAGGRLLLGMLERCVADKGGFYPWADTDVSAKRYCLYERDGEKINIVDPKAHGLGFLYPPVNSPLERSLSIACCSPR